MCSVEWQDELPDGSEDSEVLVGTLRCHVLGLDLPMCTCTAHQETLHVVTSRKSRDSDDFLNYLPERLQRADCGLQQDDHNRVTCKFMDAWLKSFCRPDEEEDPPVEALGHE